MPNKKKCEGANKVRGHNLGHNFSDDQPASLVPQRWANSRH